MSKVYCSVAAPVIVNISFFLAEAEVVDVLYTFAYQIRLGLMHLVDEHLEQVTTVDVVLA